MPIHDWSRVSAGGFHNFHQDWTIEIYRSLNRGILPPGYSAFTDLKVHGLEPDVSAIRTRHPDAPGGLAVAETPPRARLVARVETEASAYARRANRIVVRHEYGPVVAVVEVVSPGNKDSLPPSGHSRQRPSSSGPGVNLVVIDLFPRPRDPSIHHLIWGETDERAIRAAAGGQAADRRVLRYDGGTRGRRSGRGRRSATGCFALPRPRLVRADPVGTDLRRGVGGHGADPRASRDTGRICPVVIIAIASRACGTARSPRSPSRWPGRRSPPGSTSGPVGSGS